MIELRLIDRPACVFTGRHDLEPVRVLSRFPVHMGCVDQPRDDDLFADMRWTRSRSSGSIQLDPVVPLEIVYLGAHNATIGATWHAHHERFAEFLADAAPTEVHELGGGDGFLAATVAQRLPSVSWTIVDHQPTAQPRPGLRVVNGLVEPGMPIPDGVDTIVHSHFLEHVYEPRLLLESMSRNVRPGTRMVFSVPSMLEQLTKGYANALNFEHTVFLRQEYVRWLLGATGFEVLRTEAFRDHSIFFDAVVTPPTSGEVPPLPDLGDENQRLLEGFLDGMIADARAVQQRIDGWAGDVFLFGAHVFAQFLLRSGLREDRIVSVLDNNPAKAGRRLYGTGLVVEPPTVLEGVRGAAVILRAAHYNDEIRRQIKEDINGDVEFL